MPADLNSKNQLLNQSYNIPAADFTLSDIDGNEFKLSDYIGTPVVLCFFASWNDYCFEEFEFLSQTKKDFPDAAFYAISTQEHSDMSILQNKLAVIEFAEDNGLDLPVLFDSEINDSVYQKLYYVRSLPATFVIDVDGNIRSIVTSIISADAPNPYSSTVSTLLDE